MEKLILKAFLLAALPLAADTQTPITIGASTFNGSVLADAGDHWFDRGNGTSYDLDGLPTGLVELGGTTYSVRPLDQAGIILKGSGTTATLPSVQNLPVGRKADELRFLHAWQPGPQVMAWLDQVAAVREQRGERRLDPRRGPGPKHVAPLGLHMD